MDLPPVVIVRHRKERKAKCSLQPLVGRAGFRFLSWPMQEVPALEGYVRLALDGPPLSPADASRGLLLLDATWRLVQPMERAFQHVEPRSLPAAQSAYPRVSKLFEDPGGGLASIEALYLALRLMGRTEAAEAALETYRGKERFLKLNRDLLKNASSPDRQP